MDKAKAIDVLERISSLLEWIGKIACFLCFSAMIGVVFLAVLTRYALETPHNYCDSLAKYLLVWFILIVSALAIKDNSHVSIDIMVRYWPVSVRKALVIITDIMVSAFFLVVIYWGWIFARRAWFSGYSDPIVWDISFGFLYASIPIGFLYMLIEYNIRTAIFCLRDG